MKTNLTPEKIAEAAARIGMEWAQEGRECSVQALAIIAEAAPRLAMVRDAEWENAKNDFETVAAMICDAIHYDHKAPTFAEILSFLR